MPLIEFKNPLTIYLTDIEDLGTSFYLAMNFGETGITVFFTGQVMDPSLGFKIFPLPWSNILLGILAWKSLCDFAYPLLGSLTVLSFCLLWMMFEVMLQFLQTQDPCADYRALVNKPFAVI